MFCPLSVSCLPKMLHKCASVVFCRGTSCETPCQVGLYIYKVAMFEMPFPSTMV